MKATEVGQRRLRIAARALGRHSLAQAYALAIFERMGQYLSADDPEGELDAGTEMIS